MAVVSAHGGISDQLVKVMDSALVHFKEGKSVLSTAVDAVIEFAKGACALFGFYLFALFFF